MVAAPGCMQVMAKYNALFQHLLRLKRACLGLDGAWASLRRQAGAEPLQSRQPVWDVRLHMAHLLLNLQVYMQVCTAGRGASHKSHRQFWSVACALFAIDLVIQVAPGH